MKSKILYKAAVALAVFVIILCGIAVFGLMVLGLSAVQAMIAQIGLPTWSLLVFVAVLTVVCMTESDLWNFEICCAIRKAVEALKECEENA